jgi:putative ABC transport system permease protein
MIAPRWKKVLRDLWGNKTRTLLVVLSIAVGVFAVGAVTHTFSIVSQELAVTYPKANPAAATIYTEAFDDDLVQMVRRMPGVGEVEPRTMTVVQMQVGEEWKSLYLFAISDFHDIRINKVVPQATYEAAPDFHAERGTWPPPEHSISLERSSLLVPGFVPANLKVGDKVQVRFSTNSPVRDLQIAGLAHESTFFPAPFVNSAYGYITFDTLEWLTGTRRPDALYITVSDAARKLDKAHITRVAEQVRNKLEAGGRNTSIQVPEPGKHPLQDIFAGLLLLLNLLGFISLFLSGFLVVNTISALLAQQIRQIGIMKAIGARRRQIVALYLVTVLLYGVLALAIAIPSAAFVAGQLSLYLAGFINVDFPDFSIPPGILILEIAIGLLLPLLAALFPIWSGTRVTVREAISDYGIRNSKFVIRNSKFNLRARFRIPNFEFRILNFLSRPTRLSLRNTFRRKSRLALTLLTLILGGMIFIAVLSVHASMSRTLEDVFKNWQFDILLPFERAYRTDVVEGIAKQMPGVRQVESWGYTSARRLRLDDSESESLTLFAPPAQTAMVQPEIIEGRWLVPEDENALVVSTDTTRAEKDLKLGDELTLKISGRKTTWRIVGIIRVVGFRGGIGVAYANYPYYARVIGQVGRAGSVQLVTDKHDTVSQLKLKKALEDKYLQYGVRAFPGGGITSGQIRDNNEMFFNIITALLLAMAFLMAIVGGLGLMGTMSLNVLERTREIGVMRAVGASNGAVRGVILTEGLTIGVLSALIALAFSFPLGQGLAALVGEALFQLPLSYVFSMNGVILWFVIVVILSMISSFLPAYNASRLTVREILAYE